MSRYRQQPSFEGIGDEVYSGAQKAIQSSIAEDPDAYAYSYGELDKKYPIAATRPIAPAWVQDEINEEQLRRKTAEIEYKKKQYEMNLLDSQLNRENARLTQAPEVRKALANLNPQSDDFLKNVNELTQQFPIGMEDNGVQKILLKPLVDTHLQWSTNKMYGERLGSKIPSSKDVEDASFKVMEYEDRLGKIQRGEIDEATKQKYKPLNASELMEYNFNKGIMQRAASSYQGGLDQQQTMQPLQSEDQFDPVMQQAAMVIQKYPHKKDEVNKRLISVGKQPIP